MQRDGVAMGYDPAQRPTNNHSALLQSTNQSVTAPQLSENDHY